MKKFIQGMVFISIGITVLNCISATIEQLTEFINTKIAYKTWLIQKEMQDALQNDENNDTFQTGFCSTSAIGIPDIPCYEDDEDDEDYNDKKK